MPPLDPELPVQGHVELDMPVEALWEIFQDVGAWPRWNACFMWSRVTAGTLREGALLYWVFNPIRWRYVYRMPAVARIVRCEPYREVAWEVTSLPGFHALHRYLFESLGPERCRFGSWETADGPTYRLLRRFWLAHFRFVLARSLEGVRSLEAARA
jgi:hypothetical protein